MLAGEPLIIVVVTVYAGSDARGVMPSAAERWSRIVERAWAIIVVDVALSLVTGVGIQVMQSGDARDILTGTLVLFLAAMLVYAEPFICLEDNVQALTLVPFAILRSMMLAWVNMSRILLLFALQLAVSIVDVGLEQEAGRWFGTAVWTAIAYWGIVNVPLAALFVVAYLDTLSQERKLVQR